MTGPVAAVRLNVVHRAGGRCQALSGRRLLATACAQAGKAATVVVPRGGLGRLGPKLPGGARSGVAGTLVDGRAGGPPARLSARVG